MLADLACAIADGSEVISDFRVLADQKELFGQVASVPTTWRTLSEIAAGGPETLGRISMAGVQARCRAWAAVAARHGGLPGVQIADKVLEGVTCIRLDATVTAAHSDKELAEPNFKGAGRDDAPGQGGLEHGGRSPQGAGGLDRRAATGAPAPADGDVRWCRCQPASQPDWRADPAYIDAAHRVHARVDDGIRTGKDCGIGRFPSHDFAINSAWLAASLIAATLLAWLRLLALDAELARAEPKTLRYKILHAAARLTHSGRRHRLKISRTWPWARAIATAWTRLNALPQAP